MRGLPDNIAGSGHAVFESNVLLEGERSPYDFLCYLISLQSETQASTPFKDTSGKDAGAPVKFDDGWKDQDTVFILRRKCRYCCALLTSSEVSAVQERSS